MIARDRWLAVVLAGAGVCLVLLPFLWRLESASFHLHETSWILASEALFAETFLGQPPSRSPEYALSFGWPSPPLGKYVMALSVHLRVEDSLAGLARTSPPTFDRPIILSMASGHVPPLDILLSARLPMALLGAATCVAILWVGHCVWGTATGAVAAGLLALNPLMLACSRRAMIDAPALFFSALAVLLALRVASSERRAIGASLGLGIALGLAAASKLNALAGACVTALLLLSPAGSLLRAASGSALALGAAIAVFILVNPYLYSETLERAVSMLTYAHA